MNASTSGTSEPDFRVQWTPKPVEATPADVAEYGPNAAGILGVVSSARSLSEDAANVAGAAESAAGGAAGDAAYWGAGIDARLAARRAVFGVTYASAGNAARYAGVAEAASDKLTPEQYKLLTGPLVTGVAYDRILKSIPENDRGSFRSAVAAAKPTSPEQVQQIANLPRRAMDNLGSLKGDMSFDKKIAAVSRVNRAMTADRAEREANRSKAVREVK